MLYSFFLILKNVGCSSAFRPRYPNIYYRTFMFLECECKAYCFFDYFFRGISIERLLTAKEAQGCIYPFALSAARRPSESSGMNTSPDRSLLLHQPQIPPRHRFGPAIPARSSATRMFSSARQGISNSLSHILIFSVKTLSFAAIG